MDGYLIFGGVLALVVVGCYVWVNLRSGNAPQMASAVLISLSSLGVGAGLKLIVLALSSELIREALSGEDRLYMAIGGGAIVWASIEATAKSFRD